MRSFNRLREESLEEKLKASDPTGKWISDFVHSDNPKFAGKSKKERIRMALGASYAAKRQNEEVEQIDEAVHRIGLTVTDPNHPMVSKRKETIQKTVRITSDDREKAINSAKAHYRRKGYKVHDHHYLGTVNEEVEQVDEADDNTQYAIKHKMSKKILSTHKDLASAKDEWKGIDKDERPFYQVVSHSKPAKSFGMKEETELDEGSAQDKLYQQHQAIRTANKRPNPEYYKELGMSYDIQDDKARIAKQAEIKKKYKVEGAQLDQLKTMRDDPKWQENPEHKAQLDKRYKIAKDRADLDKGEVVDNAGKPVPVLTPDKFKERNPNFMKEEGEYPHQGVGVSKSMQMAADIARQKARVSLLQSKYGNEFQDKAMPDYEEDKMDLKPGSTPGTYQATVRMREKMKQENFSSLRNKIAEAKKMKGEDPCWDNYKMIGTKMKGGRQVPNCVPKESVEEASSSAQQAAIAIAMKKADKKPKNMKEGKEEQEYDYEGDMAMSDLRSILHNAKTVHDMLQPNTNIPEWCQSKITLAEDYLSTVANYMHGEMSEEVQIDEAKPGLYANIHAKRKRIKSGSGERMRKPGSKGAPTAQAFKDAAKTAKK